MTSRILLRRGTADQWSSVNPILSTGELGIETDTLKIKIGNGTSTWNQLTSYANVTPSQLTSEINNLINAAPSTLDTLNELAAAINNDASFSTTVNNLLTGKVSKSGGDTITASTASTVGLIIKGVASQTANLQEWYNSSNVLISWVRRDGLLAGQIQSPTIFQALVQPNSASGIPLTVKGFASQTAHLTEWQDSTGAVLNRINSAGHLVASSRSVFGGATSIVSGMIVAAVSQEAGAVPFLARASASQTANLQEWQNNSGTVLSKVTASGSYLTSARISAGSTSVATGNINSYISSPSLVGILVQGAASQTANLQEWQDSSGTVLSSITYFGGARLYDLGIKGSPAGIGWAYFGNDNTSTKNIVVRAFASQTANLQEWQDSAGTVLVSVLSNGRTTIRSNGSDYGAALSVGTNSTTAVGLAVRGVTSQTANLQEWQDSSGTILSKITASGVFGTNVIVNAQGTAPRITLNDASSTVLITAATASTVGTVIKGAASQTANLQEWQTSAGTVLAKVASSGKLVVAADSEIPSATILTSTAVAGGANVTPSSTANDYSIALSASGGGIGSTVGMAFQVWGGLGFNGVYQPGAGIWFTRTGGYSSGYLVLATRESSTPVTTVVERMRIGETGTITIAGFTASSIGLIVKAASSQTANLQEWQDSSGSVITRIGPSGHLLTTVQLSATSALTAGTNNYLTASLSVIPLNASIIGAVIRGYTSQTADLQQWQNSAGTALAKISAYGDLIIPDSRVAIGASSVLANTMLFANTAYSNYAPIVVRGAASQTANLQEWQNSSGTVLARIDANGQGALKSTTLTASSSGGSALTLVAASGQTAPLLSAPGGTQINSSGNYLITPGLTVNYVSNFHAGASNVTPIYIRGAASQTANLQEWQNSAGTVLARISSGGNLLANDISVGSSSAYGVGSFGSGSNSIQQLLVTNGAASRIGLIVKGAASQTANLQEWQDSAGTVLAKVDASGNIYPNSIISTGGNANSFGGNTIAGVILAVNTTNATGVVIKAGGAQTANLQEWQDSAGTVLAKVAANGLLSVGNTTGTIQVSSSGTSGTYPSTGAGLELVAGSASATDLIQSYDRGGSVFRTIQYRALSHNFYVGSSGTVALQVNSSGIGVNITPGGTSLAVVAASSSTVAAIFRGVASQTADLQQWQDSAGNIQAKITKDGVIVSGTSSSSGSGIQTGSASFTGVAWNGISNPAGTTTLPSLVVKGVTSQTANLQEWQDSAGTVLAEITASGSLELNGKDIELMNIMGAF